ncbi:SDR family oxidoreductase [Nocardia vermiculata]|uniref:SDR family oxidoreductase n=1 Tax=Nocardia vermiculata TaxID=257274 RepID=UPI000836125F|nr:SDR family oxidoreductase [Nocardia vermiculata]
MTAPVPDAQHFVRNGDIDIAVYEYGDPSAPAMLLVHGWPDDHHLWDRVIPLLAGRFHVVAYDTRGHGRSTRTDRTEDYELDRFASDFYAVADAVSPGEPVHVLAHDWGSVQVWEAVCEPRATARIASFTSVSGPNLDHLAHWTRDRLGRGALWGPATQLLSSAYTALFMTPGLNKVVMRPLSSEKIWKRFIALMNETSPDNVKLGPAFRQDFFDGMRIYQANILPRMFGPRERHTEVPVQLIVARRDIAVRPAGFDDATKWTRRLWRREIAGGHWLPFSHPELLATSATELAEAVTTGAQPRTLRRAEVGAQTSPFGDRLVVITGGGSGIGQQTALAFAALGAEVVVSDIDPDAAKRTVSAIEAAGGTAHAYGVDVSDETALRDHAAEVIAAHGVPDILINNAGIGQAGDFFDTPAAEFDRVLRVNLGGVVNGCRTFGAAMSERGLGGHIVNVSSMAAYSPQQGMSAYSTSKSAVFMFSDCLRAELAGSGIEVHTVCPGVVRTNIVSTTRFSGLSADEEAAKQAEYDALYRRRNYGPERVAQQIVAAVQSHRDIVPVTPEARVQYHFSRLAPALNRFLAARIKLT